MAVPFCKMRPELRSALAGAKAEVSKLRAAIEALPAKSRRALNSEHAAAAAEVRALDDAYRGATGQLVGRKGHMPRYADGILLWAGEREEVQTKALAVLKRIRGGAFGVRPRSAAYVRHYFSSIWPEDCPWPISRPRPAPPRDAFPHIREDL